MKIINPIRKGPGTFSGPSRTLLTSILPGKSPWLGWFSPAFSSCWGWTSARWLDSLQTFNARQFLEPSNWKLPRLRRTSLPVQVRITTHSTFVLAYQTLVGYELSRLRETDTGLSAQLNLAGPACNAFGKDVSNLTLEVTYDSNTR